MGRRSEVTHHQLDEEVEQVLGGHHHRGVQGDDVATPQGQVQVGGQLLLTATRVVQVGASGARPELRKATVGLSCLCMVGSHVGCAHSGQG